jgi:hypothetical protein
VLDFVGLDPDCPFSQQQDLFNKINNLERFHEMDIGHSDELERETRHAPKWG